MATGPYDAPGRVVADLVGRALDEDLLPLGDLSASLLPASAEGRAEFVARTDGVVAGTACATEAFRQLDDEVHVVWQVDDGDRVAAGEVMGIVTGPLASILSAERTALNFLGHLSGIATRTRAFVDAAAPLRVWDTRKTTPGLRSLEKAAVRAGGARNHRGNLSDWVMFKDNHLTALGIVEAVRSARDRWPGRTVHVECERIEQVVEALDAGADALLLDNMSPDEVRAAVIVADEHAASKGTRRALLEVSGGITLETVGGTRRREPMSSRAAR
ncbi:carboxylating nicotinate-nucleotide diphosphorylase [Aquihabitans daechungensis]|uniref:carboxylating nicotinate-nucleotide diphosphorylase n=1 Tax=Aquihabitans daechungensis TaxID=1052257 RepID=UPI003BA3C727